jgi:mRNA-degrading endonuclease RelE of RelBE toxin-antitoxin system
MPTYNIIRTADFRKEFDRLPAEIKKRFEKQFKRVEVSPFSVGKPLGNYWTRELKNKCYRTYYVVYGKEVVVLLAGVSGKKDQERTIQIIRRNMHLYERMVMDVGKFYK